ncbi:TetR/AcrR family transcriptional regulator [Methanosarcina sp. KYL-1]|nr:helix-turn-helix domain-containing protein [Methanosarcina sp. KYL-1]
MLIEIKGYENVTIRDIAEAAGVSIGLIYKYFPDA